MFKPMTKNEFWNALTKVGYERNDYARVLNAIANQIGEDYRRAKECGFEASAKARAEEFDTLFRVLEDIGYFEDIEEGIE